MSPTEEPIATNYRNASVAHFGAPNTWKDIIGVLNQTGNAYPGKRWLKDVLGLSGVEVSLSSLPAGASIPFDHTHDQNEEIYIFLCGEGQMKVDGDIFDVGAGSVVRVDPAGARCWRNTGATDLVHIVIQSKSNSLEQWTAEDGNMLEGEPAWN